MRHVGSRPVSEPVLLSLTSLADKRRHGYALMKDIEALSGGRVRLSTGTLYGPRTLAHKGGVTISELHFGAEMLAAFGRVDAERRGAKLAGLLTGATAEWIAKLTSDSSVRGRSLPDLRMMRPAGMLVGHIAVGLAAKRITPRVSVGTTVLAAVLPDLVWCVFLLAAVYFFARHYARGAWMLFAAVMSHWLLDFVAHRPDMALAPGVHPYFGLGLWNSVAATVRRIYAFWIVIVLLTLAWRGNIAGPPPPSTRAMAIGSLIFFSCVVAWAYWMNRLRTACYNSV
jgi:uncharacterized membrane protein YbaN (DUF454 family)